MRSTALALALLFFPLTASAARGGVDLHAHLFMKEGMGWLFNGGFQDPIQASNWTEGLSSQVNAEILDRTQLDIVVATIYAHPWLTLSLRESVRRQIREAREFVKSHPGWILATQPSEARTALLNHKRILVLALEGASGILETEEDLREFVDEGGIRIVTPLHLTDDAFGGVALLRGWKAMSSPLAFLYSLIKGSPVNLNGLSPEGERLIQSYLKHGVWIDLSHSSDRSQDRLVEILSEKHRPLLYTHTVLRKYHEAERGISQSQLIRLKEKEGYLGLMPSAEMLAGTPTPQHCEGTVSAFAAQFKEISAILGESSVAMGSDMNGAISHLKPDATTECHTGTLLDQTGFWRMDQAPEIWNALIRMGVASSSYTSKSATRFVDLWEKAIN